MTTIAQRVRLMYCRVCRQHTRHTFHAPWQLGGKRLLLWNCTVCRDTTSEEEVA